MNQSLPTSNALDLSMDRGILSSMACLANPQSRLIIRQTRTKQVPFCPGRPLSPIFLLTSISNHCFSFEPVPLECSKSFPFSLFPRPLTSLGAALVFFGSVSGLAFLFFSFHSVLPTSDSLVPLARPDHTSSGGVINQLRSLSFFLYSVISQSIGQ